MDESRHLKDVFDMTPPLSSILARANQQRLPQG